MQKLSNEIFRIEFKEVFRLLSTATRIKSFFWNGGSGDPIDLSTFQRPDWMIKGGIIQITGEENMPLELVSRCVGAFEKYIDSADASICLGISIFSLPPGTLELRLVLYG